MGKLGLKRKPKPKASKPRKPAESRKPAKAAATAPPEPKKLSARQAAFVSHFLILNNATQAAIKAGYSKKTADVQGPRLMGNVRVAAAVAKRREVLVQRLEITQERVLEEVARLAFADMRNYLDENGLLRSSFEGLSADQTAPIKQITIEEFKDGRSDKRQIRRTRFTLADKEKSLDMLMRHLGLYRDGGGDDRPPMTILGLLLEEIAARKRGDRAKVIEQMPEGEG